MRRVGRRPKTRRRGYPVIDGRVGLRGPRYSAIRANQVRHRREHGAGTPLWVAAYLARDAGDPGSAVAGYPATRSSVSGSANVAVLDRAVPVVAGAEDGTGASPGSGHLEAVARGGALSMVGALVSAVANLALTVVITHGVGRSTAGEFFALTSVFLLAEVLCRLGADVGLIYFLARWRALGRFGAMRVGLRVGMQPPLISAVVVGIAMFAAAEPLSRWVGAGTHGIGLLRLLAVTLPVAVTYDLCMSATRGWARMRPTVLIDKIARPTAQLALVAGVLFLGWKSALGAGWAVPYFAAAVAAIAAVRVLPWRKAGRDEAVALRSEDRRAVAREFWRFTAPRAVAAVAQLLLQRLDIVLVAALRGPIDAAIYTAATRFLVVGQFVNMALVAPAQPRLSALLALDDRKGTREVYQTTTSWLILVVWPLYLGVAALAPVYLSVFGSGYHGGYWVVVLLCLAMLVASGVGFVDVLLLMVGKTGWNLATTVAALAIDAGLDIILIPRIGIVGAAIGWCGAICAANLVPLMVVQRILHMHPFSRATLASMALAGVSFGVAPAVGALALGGRTAGAVVGVLVGAILYAIGLMRWRELLQLSLARRAVLRRKT